MRTLKGWAVHVAVGALISLCAAFAHVSPGVTLLGTVAIGFAHELGDGDFVKPQDSGPPRPLNGILDVFWFTPFPLLLWLWSLFV